jgi:alginate O-acetyltransferase complex protein AlgJ
MKGGKFRIFGLIFLFLFGIAFPVLNSEFTVVHDSENLENRQMTKRPAFDVNFLDPFPQQYEKYYNDNFTIRSLLIKYYNFFKLVAFKISPFPDRVIIGNKGWLYLGLNDMDTYLGKNRFTIDELEAYRLELEFRRDFLKKMGCTFYFTLAPCKPNIYPEHVPYTYYRYDTQCWGEQLIAYLNSHSNIQTIDLYQPLRAHKDQPLYYKLDNHWNSIGAFYAANEFCKYVSADFSSVKPLSLNDYTIKSSLKKDGNCAQILGYPDIFSDTQYDLISKKPLLAKKVGDNTWEIKGSDKPRLLIAGDSFTLWFAPFVSEQFSKTLYAFDNWEYGFNKEMAQDEKPDVYLLLISEPLMKSMLSHQSKRD